MLGGRDEEAAAARLSELIALAGQSSPSTVRLPSAGISVTVVGRGDGRIDEMLRDTFVDLLAGASEVTGELVSDRAGTIAAFDRGCDLLLRLLPGLGGDVLRHVEAIAAVRASSAMGSVLAAACGDVLPGTLIFDADHLENPWEAAGHILHEALHLKLFDISRGGALLAHPERATSVPWRRQGWDARRAYVSLHVYAHMLLFQAMVDVHREALSDEFGPPLGDNLAVGRGASPDGRDETAAARSEYLGDLLLGELSECLTEEGQKLLVWLLDATAPLLDRPRSEAPTGGGDGCHRRSRGGRYWRNEALLTRSCPRAGRLVALDRNSGELHFLNLATWLAFELCDGLAGVEERYAGTLSGKADAAHAAELLDRALEELIRTRLVTEVPPEREE